MFAPRCSSLPPSFHVSRRETKDQLVDSRSKRDSRSATRYDEHKDNEAARWREVDEQLCKSRVTRATRRRRYSLSSRLSRKGAQETAYGIGRRGSDPVRIAMLKIEGNGRNDSGGRRTETDAKGRSVVLLHSYLRADLHSPLLPREHNFNIQRVPRRIAAIRHDTRRA